MSESLVGVNVAATRQNAGSAGYSLAAAPPSAAPPPAGGGRAPAATACAIVIVACGSASAARLSQVSAAAITANAGAIIVAPVIEKPRAIANRMSTPLLFSAQATA